MLSGIVEAQAFVEPAIALNPNVQARTNKYKDNCMSVEDVISSGIPLSEYDRRWEAALDALSRAGLDCACITAPRSINYFTGHDARAADMAPFILIIAPGRPRMMVARLMDRTSILHESIPLEVRTYFSGREDAIPAWAETLRELDLGASRVGLELDNWGLAPQEVEDLRVALPDMVVDDASWVIGKLMDRKSDIEIEIIKRAVGVTDKAFEAFYDAVRPGASETSIEECVRTATLEHGAEFKKGDTNTLIGSRTVLPHGEAGASVLKSGDVATLETGAIFFGYSGSLARTALYGENAHAQRLHDICEGAVSAAIAAVRPGAAAGDVDEAGRSIVRNAGYDHGFNHRMGYSIGLGWNSRCGLSVRPGSQALIEESMALHIICFLYDLEAAVGVVTSESLIVTPDGSDVLSRLPRELRRKPESAQLRRALGIADDSGRHQYQNEKNTWMTLASRAYNGSSPTGASVVRSLNS